MKVVVNDLGECKRGLEVEVPWDLVAKEMEREFREYSQRASVPGFRKGKIPMDIVRRRFEGEVREEVVRRMVSEYALKALEEKKLEPIQPPVLDEVHHESGQPLTFKATFEMRPVVEVSGHLGMSVSVERQKVTEEMIETSLRSLAERAATLEAVDGRPVQKGDYVIGTMSCRFLRGQGKNITDESLFLEAGSETNHPDFNAALLGMEAGETTCFETDYPDDYNSEALRGRTVQYTLAVKEIKKKTIPPLDDELAKQVGDFKTLADLRAKVSSELENRARELERSEARRKILTDLTNRYPVAVPQTLVEREIDGRLEAMAREMMARGIDPAKAKIDWAEERERLRPGATDGVRAMLILESIAAQEGIEATGKEVEAWLQEEARRHHVSVASLKGKLVESARMEGVKRQIVRQKSLDFLLRGANITSEEK